MGCDVLLDIPVPHSVMQKRNHIDCRVVMIVDQFIWIRYTEEGGSIYFRCLSIIPGPVAYLKSLWQTSASEFMFCLCILRHWWKSNVCAWLSIYTIFLCQCTKFLHRNKIEKEKREHAKQHGLIRTEISGGEIAEEMEKERRLFQLQMCEVRNVVHIQPTSGEFLFFEWAAVVVHFLPQVFWFRFLCLLCVFFLFCLCSLCQFVSMVYIYIYIYYHPHNFLPSLLLFSYF